jgi:hypothetical protein
MKNASHLSLLWGFLVSIAATAVILVAIPFDEQKLGFQRVDALLQRETGLREVVANRCGQLVGRSDSTPEKLFLERYAPPVNRDQGESCTLTIVAAQRQRFSLRTYWHYLIQIQSDAKAVLFERHYAVETPCPLVLLPLAVLLLALVFEMPSWGLGWTLGSFVFALSGINLIAAVALAWKSFQLTFSNDPTLPGYLLIAAWLALLLAHRPASGPPRAPTRRETWGNRIANAVVGLWSPGVYTIAGQLLFPVKSSFARALPFLDTQLVLVGLSLYLFSLDIHHWRDFLRTGVSLPRYFTYTALLFITVSNWSLRPRRQVPIWHREGIWRALAALVVVEGIASQWPPLKSLPTVTRFGAALFASQIVWPMPIDWKRAVMAWLPWAGMILLASFATSLAIQSGAMDMMLVIAEPRIHPIGLVFFTFLAGIAMGFLAGNFSQAFFALFTLMLKSTGQPLVHAALLDGVFAGILLSPFSLYNLVPSVQFRLSHQDLLKFRFKQLMYPLGIGSLIYAVSAVNSVAILRPATFVFLCLAALAFQLRKSYWQIGQHTFSLETGRAPR